MQRQGHRLHPEKNPSCCNIGVLLRATAYNAIPRMLSPVRLSVRLSVTRVDQSKTLEVRIMQLSRLSSPMTL